MREKVQVSNSMMAKEFFSDQDEGNHEESTLLQDPYEEEEEETLSLCDLPTYSTDSADWDDYLSKEEGQSSSQSNEDDDFFEFSSEEFTTSSHETTAKNIIFCGKLIPFKDIPQQHRDHQNDGVNLPWRPNSCDKAKPIMSRTGTVTPSDAKGSKNNNLCDYASIKKVSLVRSTTKSRWYLFMFGFGMSSRVSTEMDLSDIRSRQSRRGPATMIPASEQGGEMVKSKGKKRNMKGLLRIWKSLDFGCLSSNVVKASFV